MKECQDFRPSDFSSLVVPVQNQGEGPSVHNGIVTQECTDSLFRHNKEGEEYSHD